MEYFLSNKTWIHFWTDLVGGRVLLWLTGVSNSSFYPTMPCFRTRVHSEALGKYVDSQGPGASLCTLLCLGLVLTPGFCLILVTSVSGWLLQGHIIMSCLPNSGGLYGSSITKTNLPFHSFLGKVFDSEALSKHHHAKPSLFTSWLIVFVTIWWSPYQLGMQSTVQLWKKATQTDQWHNLTLHVEATIMTALISG